MSYQPHYIASFEEDSGLFTYTQPFLAPEKAFPILEDAYCFRGTVIRRPGFTLLGRLRRILTTVSIPGGISSANTTYDLFALLGISATQPDAQMQPGSLTSPITVVVGPQTLTDDTGTGSMSIAPLNPIDGASINYSTGILTLHFSAVFAAIPSTITFSYYPGLPVMGLRTQELGPINDEGMIAFDTRYAYWFNDATKQFEELPSATPVTWNGTNSDFFWSINYWTNPTAPPSTTNRLFWATNTNMTGSPRDPIRYYNGYPTDIGATWSAPFNPKLTDTGNKSYLYNAEIILPYKGRLLFLNTWEGEGTGAGFPPDINKGANFPQRVRYSQQGNPLDVDAFRTDIIGKGGYVGAPTAEAIVGAEYIKDTLIVKFERSSWKLVYTGNEVLPFFFEKINTELGSESKFSLVPFDRGVFSVADYGITTDDSVNVQRIDLQIPNSIFQFNNDQQGPARVHGIRDYVNELVYWTYPTSRKAIVGGVPSVGYPDKVLILNYRNSTYAKLNDSFTCYGYFQPQLDETWSSLPYDSWQDWEVQWDSGSLQSLFPDVIAGNQQGFVEIVASKTLNDPSLFIKSISIVGTVAQFTIPQHNLSNNDIIKITNVVGAGAINPSGLNGLTYKVNVINPDTISLQYFLLPDKKFYSVYDPNNTVPNLIDATSIYIGNGIITKINNFKIQTKTFAPFYEAGSQCRLGYIDFLLFKTSEGEITSKVFIDENTSIPITDQSNNPCLNGTQVVNTKPENLTLIPFQATQDKIWHRQFIQAIAQNFTINLSMSPEQNATEAIANNDFQLYAIAFYLSQNARLTQ